MCVTIASGWGIGILAAVRYQVEKHGTPVASFHLSAGSYPRLLAAAPGALDPLSTGVVHPTNAIAMFLGALVILDDEMPDNMLIAYAAPEVVESVPGYSGPWFAIGYIT